MTDQDNLRDRIAAVIFAADVKTGAIHIDLWTDLKGEYQNAAQAIIDEFGLAVEEREIDETRWPDEYVNYRIARVVGKWERQ